MILKDLKEGTKLINPSGIIWTIKHIYFKRAYQYTEIHHNLTKIAYVRKEIRLCEVYNPKNIHHLRNAKKAQKEHGEYLMKKSKWSFNE
jgi:hypothetical protein